MKVWIQLVKENSVLFAHCDKSTQRENMSIKLLDSLQQVNPVCTAVCTNSLICSTVLYQKHVWSKK